MGKATEISWTHSTFNPWWGCAKVSAGCKNCYAESFAKRVGQKVWGEGGERRVFGEKHWAEPLAWNRDAAAAGERRRVFCASMADVFEDHPIAAQERPRLWDLIGATPALDWLLLTKRPENIPAMLPAGAPLPNVWLGTTAENQEMADLRIPLLLAAPAVVRFVSAEPLLGPLDLAKWMWPVHWRWDAQFETPEEAVAAGAHASRHRQALVWAGSRFLDWVIVGGESGHHARPFALEWAAQIVRQCREAGAAAFVKQLGDDPWEGAGQQPNGEPRLGARYGLPTDKPEIVGRLAPKGGDVAQWPEELRVREFPGGKGGS